MVPPDVVDIDGDFEIGGLDFGAEVIGRLEGGNGAAIATVTGVERLDEEFDAELGGVCDDGSDAVTDLIAVGEGGLTNGGAADEDDAGHAKFGGIAQPLAVGFEVLLASGFFDCGEEAAAHVGDGGESGVGVLLADRFQVLAFDGFAPNGDAADVSLGKAFDALGDGPRFGGKGVEGDVRITHGIFSTQSRRGRGANAEIL